MPFSLRQVLLAVAVLVAAVAVGGGRAVLLSGGSERTERDTATAAVPAATAAPAVPVPSATSSPTPATPATTTPAPVAPAAAPPVPALNEAELRSAPVPSLCDHPAGRLRDGSLPGIPPGRGEVTLGKSAFGDLDGDGVDEAAVVLSCSGGNDVVTDVFVYAVGPRLVGRVPVEEGLHSEVHGHAVRVTRGRLEVSGLFQDDDDPRCCPTGVVVRQYRLAGGRLLRVPAPGVDAPVRLTDGEGWSTVRVGADYQELARATGLPVSVDALQDGPPSSASCA